MNKLILLLSLLLITKTGFAQKDKDTVVYNLPVVNGKLVYTDTIKVKGVHKASLDSIAKKWFIGYFKHYQLDTLSKDKDTSCTIQSFGLLEYHVKPGLISIPFYAVITMNVNCKENNYSYKIYNIYFRTKSRTLNAVGYQNDPEYLIGLYKQKHLGLITSMSIDRSMIRNYLSSLNTAVLDCIASFNKAMAN